MPLLPRLALGFGSIAAVLTIVLVLVCGSQEGSEESGLDLLTNAFANLAQDGFSIEQTSLFSAQGATFEEEEVKLFAEAPDKIYVKISKAGQQSKESVTDGTRAFTRYGTEPWVETSPRNPGAFFKVFAIADYVTKVESSELESESGANTISVRVQLDASRFPAGIADLSFLSPPLGATLPDRRFALVEVVYYVDMEQRLPLRSLTRLEYEADGVMASATVSMKYSVLDGPITFPADLPSR